MTKRTSIAVAVLSLSVLGACGSSLGYVEFASATSTRVDDLNAQTLTPNSSSTSQVTGELNRLADTLDLGVRSGTINAARTQVALNGGGTIDLTGVADYARFFDLQQSGVAPTRGIIGIPTRAGNMPKSNTGTYNGVTRVTVQDGLDLYDLDGTATATANFGLGTLNVVLDNLDGTQSTLTGSGSVTDVATITVNNAIITGNTASGGTASLSSSSINNGNGFSGSQSVQHEAGFYGPGADEVGGVLLVDDTSVQVFADYLTD